MVYIKEKINWGGGEEYLGPRHYFRLRKIISLLPKGKFMVLDGAIGLGTLSKELAKKGYRPIGIDRDWGAALYSYKKKIPVVLGDINNLPFKDKVFPLVVSSETLEHLDNYKRGLEEFYRVLKGGGFLIASLPLNEKFWSYWDDWAGHKIRFPHKNLEEIFVPFKIRRKIFSGFPFLILYEFIFLKYFIKRRGGGKIGKEEKRIWIILKALLIFPLKLLFSFSIPLRPLSTNLIIKLEKLEKL